MYMNTISEDNETWQHWRHFNCLLDLPPNFFGLLVFLFGFPLFCITFNQYCNKLVNSLKLIIKLSTEKLHKGAQ